MDSWDIYIKGFESYLLLERSLSKHSIEAYLLDVAKLAWFANQLEPSIPPEKIEYLHLEQFVLYINELGLGARSQSRILSGIKAFYKYMLVEDVLDRDPTELLEGPRISQKIPTVMSIEEVDAILQASFQQANDYLRLRNYAILEVLYACGLRVSELVNLKFSNLFLEIGVVRVIGKNNKERIIPIGEQAVDTLKFYLEQAQGRPSLKTQKGHEPYVFLNRRGKQLTRVMIFTLIKNLAKEAGIEKKVSPHTFRHTFATHLMEGGADLRAIQDMLGHESIQTTEIYTHLDTDYLRETIMMFHPLNKKEKRGEP